jgi:hypothetical protein
MPPRHATSTDLDRAARASAQPLSLDGVFSSDAIGDCDVGASGIRALAAPRLQDGRLAAPLLNYA